MWGQRSARVKGIGANSASCYAAISCRRGQQRFACSKHGVGAAAGPEGVELLCAARRAPPVVCGLTCNVQPLE